ncbi:MAG: ribosome small subunit-dependent GTPase A [Patescibacteria group bacterium]|nr:ribosome small subunit-dependent GTPase A [Patescibacteria group bacterium]
MKNETVNLEDLGYGDFFETNRKEKGLGGFGVGRVIAEYKGAYKVKSTNGEYLAKVTGRQMFTALSREDFPAVGDFVAITALGSGNAVINGILPRKTVIKRKQGGGKDIQIIAANIDVAFVVESIGRDYNLNRLERYFAIVNDGGAKPAIILNKTDLVPKEDLDAKLEQIKNRFGGADVIFTSTVTQEGLDELKSYIAKGKTYCFLGSSGVGKSSLINKLIGGETIKTKGISLGTSRGKHTTTTREMYFLSGGGIVIDNPGMREVGLADAGAGVENVFEKITLLAQECKFTDCTHTHEPGCAVLLAVNSGKLDKGQYANFLNLKKEADYYEMSDFEKRKKDRDFGKFVKKAKKELKSYRNKF